MLITKKTRFATEGFRVMRKNPDGTLPKATRFLGFVGTCSLNATGLLTAKKANLTIKIDTAAAVTKSVDFTAAVDLTAVTVAEAVTALTAAAFANVTFSADATTGRLKGVAASGTFVQVTGPLAAALDFGQGIAFGGNGLEWQNVFSDRAVSIALPKNKKDKEQIDLEGAKGGITRMIISAKILGISPAIVMKDKDYKLLTVIQGGTYDDVNGTYDPPLSSATKSAQFFMEIYSPIYSSGANKSEDLVGYEKLLLRNCTGMEGDVPAEAKAWAKYSYDIEATEYTDENGVNFAAWQEGTISSSDFEAQKIANS